MKKRNLIFGSVAMLMVSVLALTTAAYAWFVNTQEPYIESIRTEVIKSDDLALATAYNGTYKSVLTAAEIEGASLTHRPPAAPTRKLNAVSLEVEDHNVATAVPVVNYDAVIGTSDVISFEKEGSLTGTDYDPGLADTDNFVRFTIFFRSAVKSAVYMYFAGDGANLVADEGGDKTSFTAPVAAGTLNDTQAKADVKMALRFAWAHAAETVAGAASGNDSFKYAAGQLKIFEPYKGAVSAYRSNGGKQKEASYTTISVADVTTPASTVVPSATTGFMYHLFDFTTGAHDVGHVANETHALTFYLWIEGNDMDCTAAAAAGYFLTQVYFAGMSIA